MIKRQHDTDMYPGNNTHAPANQTNVPISLDCVALQKVFFYFHMQKKPEVEGKKERKEKEKAKLRKKASIHVMLVSISEHLKIHGNF